jgi:mono/diheme cytochrome c family protein
MTHYLVARVARFVAPACLALVMALAGCEEEGPSLLVPKADTTSTPGTTGESLFRYYCSACHGLDGRPLVAGVDTDLRDYDSSYHHFDSVLTTGAGIMPTYPQLTPQQRQLVYERVIGFSR